MGEVWTPRAYQEAVLAWLRERDRGAVWSSTGTGKTAIAATWLDGAMRDRLEVSRTLVVAPPMVIPGWRGQMARWRHLQALLPMATTIDSAHLDLKREVRASGRPGGLAFRDRRGTKKRLQALPGRIHLCSWAAFPWVEAAYGRNWPYDCLVLDESTFVKDMRSERGKAARRAVHRSGRVTHLLELTASPNSNHDEAVYAQLDLVERGCLGPTLTAFREKYCVPASKDWQSGQVYSWKVAPPMRSAFNEVCQRLAVSVPDQLGIELLEVEQMVSLPPHAQAEYDHLEKHQVLADVTAASRAILQAKLRQVASGFVYTDTDQEVGTRYRQLHSAKIDRFAELVEAIDGPVLVAYLWDFEREWLAAHFKSNFMDIRQRGAKAKFEQGGLKILGLHPKSAGHGVDGLQGASNNVIWTSVPDDRELYDQVNGRLKRDGQDADTVFVHMLIAQGTREERIWREVLPGKLTRSELAMQAARVVVSGAAAAER